MMKIKIVFLLLCAALFSFSATYYVSPSGADLADGKTQTTAWRTIDRVENAPLASGDVVLFERGGVWRELLYVQTGGLTFGAYGTGARPIITGVDLLTSGWTPKSQNVWRVQLAVEPRQVWFDGIRGIRMDSEQAVLGQNAWTYSGGQLIVYSATDPATSHIEASQRGCALSMSNVSSETFQSIDFRAGNDLAIFIGTGMTGIQLFQDVVWEQSPAEGLMALSGTIHVRSSIGQNNIYGIGVYGGSGLFLSGSILSGNADMALMIADTTAPSVIESSTITGNSTSDSATHVINNWSDQPLTASNSVLLGNPYLSKDWNFLGLIDDGTNVYQSPAFTARAAPVIVVPYIDDYNNLDVAQVVADDAAAYGFHISFAVNTGAVTRQGWRRISALQAAGNDIVAHTRTHSDLGSLNIFTLQYTGSATAATVTIDIPTAKLQTFLNHSATPDLNIALDEYGSAIDLCSYINSRSGYSCSMPATQYWFNLENLSDVSGISIVAPYTVRADPNRYYAFEIDGAKADIEANVPGYVATTFATPYSSSARSVEERIHSTGFELNRNGLPVEVDVTSIQLSHLDLYNVAAEWAGGTLDSSNLRTSVDALVEGLGASGGIIAVYSHGYDEFTLDQWTTVFAELKALGVQCMTASQAVSFIKSAGALVPDGSGRYWNHPVKLSPDYSGTISSPTQGAHLQ
jgi:hypothetical protein